MIFLNENIFPRATPSGGGHLNDRFLFSRTTLFHFFRLFLLPFYQKKGGEKKHNFVFLNLGRKLKSYSVATGCFSAR
jgi:hypothetical protein